MSANRLIIFAKAPVPGRVKTRLCPPLKPLDAARLHAAFIEDTLDKALSLGSCEVTLAYTPEASLSHFRQIVGGRIMEFVPQHGPDLGARMHGALSRAFEYGADKAALIGTDIPTLEPATIAEAFIKLDTSDLVLGPSEDGGYYLVAMKRPWPGLFEGMTWSSPEVLGKTLERADRLGIKVSLLPSMRDVDTPDDLAALTGAALPPRTRAVMDMLGPSIAAWRDKYA